jgi:hypothetical protein
MEATGLSHVTIRLALKGEYCSPQVAIAIATAIGKPSRWLELVTEPKRKEKK